MKIINFSAYDRPKGLSTRSFDIMRGLFNIGHDVIFVTNNFCHFEKKYIDIKSTVIDGVRCIFLGTPGYNGNVGRFYNSIVNFFKILSFKKIKNLDLVIGPSVPITSGLAAYIFARFCGAKFIFEIRDVWPAALVMLGGVSKINPIYWIYRWIEVFLYRKSDLIVSSLPNVNKYILDINPRAFISYIPNPISNDIYFNISKSCPSPCPDFHKKTPIITYIGGFGLVHDIDTLIGAAIYYINKIDRNVEFNFYGNGAKWEGANFMIKSLGLSRIIKLHGHIPKIEALSKAKESDVLIAAVSDSDIFDFGINMNKLYLYMAAGVPIAFAGNVPFNIISDNNFGVSVTAGNHIDLANGVHDLVNSNFAFRNDVRRRMRVYIENNLSELAVSCRYQDLISKLINNERC
jgi:hypothetical protein